MSADAPQPDEIAALLAETSRRWSALLPGVDARAVEIVGRVESLARYVAEGKRRALAPFGLNFAEWTTLTTLRISPGGRRSPTALRRRIGQTSAGMARVLAKLADGGWVRREALADDGRRSDVVLTARGRRLADQSFRAVQDAQSAQLGALGRAERARLVRDLDRLLEAFRLEDAAPPRAAAGSGP